MFPALHGPFGEDGTVQGLLEMLDVAYVGAGVAASAVCLDKVLFKQLMAAVGVPQVDYVGVRAERFARSRAQVLRGDRARSGCRCSSSPRTSAPRSGSSRSSAAERARRRRSSRRSRTTRSRSSRRWRTGSRSSAACSARSRASATAGERGARVEPGEIVFAGEWYDFDAKYAPGGMELRCPRRSPPSAAERVRELACEASSAAGCEGLARVDFFVDGERVLVNELNTMPGFTPTSVYAKLMAATGVAYPELVDRLCRLALERHDAPARLPTAAAGRLPEQREVGDRRRLHVRAAAS